MSQNSSILDQIYDLDSSIGSYKSDNLNLNEIYHQLNEGDEITITIKKRIVKEPIVKEIEQEQIEEVEHIEAKPDKKRKPRQSAEVTRAKQLERAKQRIECELCKKTISRGNKKIHLNNKICKKRQEAIKFLNLKD